MMFAENRTRNTQEKFKSILFYSLSDVVTTRPSVTFLASSQIFNYMKTSSNKPSNFAMINV